MSEERSWQKPLSREQIQQLSEDFDKARERIESFWGAAGPRPWIVNRRRGDGEDCPSS